VVELLFFKTLLKGLPFLKNEVKSFNVNEIEQTQLFFSSKNIAFETILIDEFTNKWFLFIANLNDLQFKFHEL
jgi:hypothetical protein